MLLPLIKHLAAGGACSGGHPGQNECQVRNKPTLNCAAQQNGAGPLPPIRWHPVIGGSVTGKAVPRPGNPAVRMLGIAGSVKWRSRPKGAALYRLLARCAYRPKAVVHTYIDLFPDP
jgi:hypothetical protein